MSMLNKSQILLKSFIGGILIGLGGTCFLSVDDRIIGAVLFSLGLLAICATDQYLFTGKCSYTDDYVFLLLVLFGNIIGAYGMGILIREIKPNLIERASAMCDVKLAENIRLLPLGILCNILIYFAVEGYKNGKTILLIMCVTAFILCGFEHCVANIFYFGVSGIVNISAIMYLLTNVVANWIGGMLVLMARIIIRKE